MPKDQELHGGIVRVVKDGKYFTASNEPFNDKQLSWETRGLLGYLFSKPNGWETRVPDLVKQAPKAKEYKVRRMLIEARKYGYMARIRITQEDGTYEWCTYVYESPSLNPYLEANGAIVKLIASSSRKSTTGTSSRLSTRGSSTRGKSRSILNTEGINTDRVNTDKEEEEDGDAARFSFSPTLQDRLQALGVYVPIWKEVESALADGWTEIDMFALMRWARAGSQDDMARAAGKFVKRFREGTKAPAGYYKIERKLGGMDQFSF